MRSNTDLSDNELEINVIRGIGYSVANPKEVDTYVKIEFPYPQVRLIFIMVNCFNELFFLGNPIPSKITINSRHGQSGVW